MKLNPFSKKPSAYYSKVKAEFEQLDQELRAARAELQEAEADCEQKRRIHFELTQRGSIYSSNNVEGQASLAASEASNRVTDIRGRIGQLESRIAPLRRIAVAPETFAQAKAELEDLLEQQRTATSEVAKLEGMHAKISKRLAAAEARVAAETQAATQTMLDAEGDFAVPDSLARAETELRLAKTSQAEIQGKKEELAAKLSLLPKAIREAERAFIERRAVMTEIELYDQLMPVMPLFARASVARRQSDIGHKEGRLEIEIPPDLIESAKAALSSEISRI